CARGLDYYYGDNYGYFDYW
nr:immunoglobulin heavy chain junction region [Mus musculus]